MLTYLVKENIVYEEDLTRLEYKKKLKSGNYRPATLNERRAFLDRKDQEIMEMLQNPNITNVYYKAPTSNSDGYGNSSRHFKARAVKYGYYLNERYDGQKVGLCYHLPNTLSLVKTPIKIAYTMFESDQYPQFWEPWLKSADEVLVPTQFCADIMYKNFKISPTVVPLGVDPDVFHYVDRVRDEKAVFTLLHFDAFKWRKGWDIVFTAFNEEFGETDGDDVRLVFKTTLDITPPLHQYPKITKITGRLQQSSLLELLADADCFVFPTRGEGFGLTPLEAMATGMPAIIPNHTGLTHYFDDRFCYGLEYEEIKAKYDNRELRQLDLGTQWEPTVESVRKQMRQAYNDWKTHTQDERTRYYKQIAEYASQYSIETTTKLLCDVLAKYV